MSVRVMGEVWRLDLAATEKLVLLAVADHADDDGTGAYPSVARLAWKCGIARRSVQRVLRRLEEAGLLVPLAPAWRHQAVVYWVVTAAGRPLIPFDDWKGQAGSPFRGDPVSPLGGGGATLTTFRGDIDDIEGRPCVALTIREPSEENHPAARAFVCDQPGPFGPCGVYVPCFLHDPAFPTEPPNSPVTNRPRRLVYEALAFVSGLDPTGRTLTRAEQGRLKRAAADVENVGGHFSDVIIRAAEYRRRWPDVDLTPTALAGNWGTLAVSRAGSIASAIARFRTP